MQMQNISLRSSRMRRKQNFEILEFWGLWVTQQSWLLPSFFLFSCLIFFLLLGILVGFILVGNVFGKAFRILGLDERKGRWVVQQDFHGDFQVNVLITWCFSFSSGVLDWIVLTHFASLKNILGNGVSRRSRLLGCLKARPRINPL